jgi:hypothetical protein
MASTAAREIMLLCFNDENMLDSLEIPKLFPDTATLGHLYPERVFAGKHTKEELLHNFLSQVEHQ